MKLKLTLGVLLFSFFILIGMPTLNAIAKNEIELTDYTSIPLNDIAVDELDGLTYHDIFENETEGITLPNGIKTFEISGNDLVQKVMKYTLQSADIITLDNLEQWQRVVINKPLDYIGYNLFYTSFGSVKIEGFTSANYNNTSSMIGKITADAYASRFTLGFNLGTYADLDTAQADLNGKIIYYQLATPIVLQTFTTAPSQEQIDYYLSEYVYNIGKTTYRDFELYPDEGFGAGHFSKLIHKNIKETIKNPRKVLIDLSIASIDSLTLIYAEVQNLMLDTSLKIISNAVLDIKEKIENIDLDLGRIWDKIKNIKFDVKWLIPPFV